MHAATVGFDVDGFARDQFQRISISNGLASFTTQSLRFLVSLSPKKVINLCGAAIGSLLVQYVRRDVRRIKEHTLVFRSLRDELRVRIQETGVYPSAALLGNIDRAQASLVKLRSVVKTVCFLLREVNADSRLAAMFEVLEKEVNELMSAVYRFRLVAIGADIAERSWEETVQAGRQTLLDAAASIGETGEEGLDPELYALAMSAIQNAEQRA